MDAELTNLVLHGHLLASEGEAVGRWCCLLHSRAPSDFVILKLTRPYLL